MEFEIGLGAAQYHTYTVSGKSIEARMNVFIDQLLSAILIDDKMSQSKKVMVLDFINRKQIMLSKKANNGAKIPYAAQADFKHGVREKVLKLIFKKTISSPDEFQRRGKI